MKGSYILLMELKEDKNIDIGKLGNLLFRKGFYAYMGSALSGIEKRIERHTRVDKKMHWHIDYLLKYAEIRDVFYEESDIKEECEIAKEFSKNLEPIIGFGCSDCKCKSHLFYGSIKIISETISKLNMQKYLKT